MRKLLFILLILVIAIGLGFAVFAMEGGPVEPKNESEVEIGGELMTVHFIDVGQGDATFIDYGDYEILVDGGNNRDGVTVSQYMREYVDGQLELVVATHPDADHIGGLDDVLKAYAVTEVIDSGETKDTVTYGEYYGEAANSKLTYDEDRIIDVGGGASLKIIETGDDYANSNDNSVVALLTYGSVSVLLTGDMEAQAERASLTKFQDIDVLKAGHHGSETSSSSEFLSVTKPEYIVISAGIGNTYGHPHAEAIQRFADIGAVTYATTKSGTIVMSTDGSSISFSAADMVTAADAGDATPTFSASASDRKSLSQGKPEGGNDMTQAIYIGNKNSKVFHTSTCASVAKMSDGNKVSLDSYDTAVNYGYVPCKVCGGD